MFTIVYAIQTHGVRDAILFYKDGRLIECIDSIPICVNIERLVEKLTNQKPEVLSVQQTGKKYPDFLSAIKAWPKFPG